MYFPLWHHPLWLKADAVWRLGLWNVARVADYRLRLRLGIHPVQRVRRNIGGSCFFRPTANSQADALPPPPTPSHWDQDAFYFGWYRVALGAAPPDWHANPFTGERVADSRKPWWQIGDFASGAGDIKTVWEPSRFDWVMAFAQRAAVGEVGSLSRLNHWLADWCRANPTYLGANWKCGQEASIRILHLAVAARLLGQWQEPEADLRQLVEAHLARIYPTLHYAMAQDNNHGTSEAAAMFVGGAWCRRWGYTEGDKWAKAGRRWLENRVARLITPDGSFSQHSVNYHRLMLDTLSLVELWRRWLELPGFSARFYQRAAAATRWLLAMSNAENGDAPNLGANDGANLLPLTDADYRDYRPCVQLASALFLPQPVYGGVELLEQHLAWLGITDNGRNGNPDLPTDEETVVRSVGGKGDPVESSQPNFFHAKGYIVLCNGPWRVIFRYPHSRFRPSHCDALHVDLWYGAENILCDGGSYGYAAERQWVDYFTGPAAHNTIQFDGRDPMPRVGPFLRAKWLNTEAVAGPFIEGQTVRAQASYRDSQGAFHQREVVLSPAGLKVVDKISGFKSSAVLRWRLGSDDHARKKIRQSDDGVQARDFYLRVEANQHITRQVLAPGWESRYYLRMEERRVYETEVSQAATLKTELRWLT